MSTDALPAPASGKSVEAVPWIISVDNHVTEPPDLWTSRLPHKFKDRGH